MAATALPRFDPPRLARFLSQASGARDVRVSEPELLAGGAIQENWGFDAEFTGGDLAGRYRLVLRTDAATGVVSSLSRIEEFAVQQAAFAAGVTVAEPLWGCADPGVIGRPFFIMRRVPGTAQGREITADPAIEPFLSIVAARLGAELARIQTIRPLGHNRGFLPCIDAARHIAGFRAYLDRHPNPRPVLEGAISWLQSHIPEKLPPVLCHRDFRTGNYMLAPTLPSPAGGRGSGRGLDGVEVTAILDWEFAGWGDPDEDIGWFCCKGWRFARLDREAGGISAREAFYRAYEAASGRRLDPERVRFWEVLANVRWAVIALQQSDRHLVQGARDLVTALIGRRATECELELLMLLDADKATAFSRGDREGVRGAAATSIPAPSASLRYAPAPSLSGDAGEGFIGPAVVVPDLGPRSAERRQSAGARTRAAAGQNPAAAAAGAASRIATCRDSDGHRRARSRSRRCAGSGNRGGARRPVRNAGAQPARRRGCRTA